jgi:hypothetical protein
MQGDLVAAIPFLAVVALCLAQFVRPTLLVWFTLIALFFWYAIEVALHFQPPVNEFVLFLLSGAVPVAGLLWCWPKPATTSGPQSSR